MEQRAKAGESLGVELGVLSTAYTKQEAELKYCGTGAFGGMGGNNGASRIGGSANNGFGPRGSQRGYGSGRMGGSPMGSSGNGGSSGSVSSYGGSW